MPALAGGGWQPASGASRGGEGFLWRPWRCPRLRGVSGPGAAVRVSARKGGGTLESFSASVGEACADVRDALSRVFSHALRGPAALSAPLLRKTDNVTPVSGLKFAVIL